MKPIFIVALIGLIYFLLPKNKNSMEATTDLLRSIPDNHYEELCEYAPNGSKEFDSSFWRASDGIGGLVERLHISFVYLRIVQAHRRDGTIDISDAAVVGGKLLSQTFYSLLALPEAAVDQIWHREHAIARRSLGVYCELVIRTNTLCFSVFSQKCPIRLHKLL